MKIKIKFKNENKNKSPRKISNTQSEEVKHILQF